MDRNGDIAGLYDLGETIGKGNFAVVKLARHVFTGERVAVKVIDKTKLDDIARANLFQEVRCMKLVQHPNVVRLYEVIDTSSVLFLVMELGTGGDMYERLLNVHHGKGLPEEKAQEYFRQIISAIDYCHRLHVVHRDLKLENVVFFEKTNTLKLTDFGFSNRFTPGHKLATSCGSLGYTAPEMLLGDNYDAPAVDIWSLGVMLYMLVAGEGPFTAANDSEMLTNILDCKYPMPLTLSADCKSLLRIMLVREPSDRSSLDEILGHPWVKSTTPINEIMADQRPLVWRRDQISDEVNKYVMRRMIDGKIASKDEIIRSLEKDEYNHVNATYFLLSERVLRRQQQASLNIEAGTSPTSKFSTLNSAKGQLVRRHPKATLEKPKIVKFGVKSAGCSPQLSPDPQSIQVLNESVTPTSGTKRQFIPQLPNTIRTRQRVIKNSTLHENTIAEKLSSGDDSDLDTYGCTSHKHTNDSHSDSEDSPRSSRRHGASNTASARPLHNVKSSPQLLFINEDEEADVLVTTLTSMTLDRRPYRGDPTTTDATYKGEPTTTKRRDSASSSQDEGSNKTRTGRISCKDGLKSGRRRRGDSSDHSSDTDPGSSSFHRHTSSSKHRLASSSSSSSSQPHKTTSSRNINSSNTSKSHQYSVPLKNNDYKLTEKSLKIEFEVCPIVAH